MLPDVEKLSIFQGFLQGAYADCVLPTGIDRACTKPLLTWAPSGPYLYHWVPVLPSVISNRCMINCVRGSRAAHLPVS